ncbi:MAG TPA: hypothetical protein VGL92_00490, partial [Acidimicrobiia bacterium]
GANALIVGNYLTTLGRAPADDVALLESLGMPVAGAPGEGRFVVAADGTHALPPRPPAPPTRRRIPVDVAPGPRNPQVARGPGSPRVARGPRGPRVE